MQSRKTKVNIDIITREARRKHIAQYLQQSLTEIEIAQRLGVNVSTISRDIQVLKQAANQFVYDLAKADLAYFYKDIIDDLNKARLNAWEVYHKCTESEKREKLLALKTVIASNTEMFNLLQAGPMVMSVKGIQEQLNILLDQDRGQQV